MHGELQYKDVHGRVWRIFNRNSFDWEANTLDVGHTRQPAKHDLRLEMLLASIDREEFTTDDRSTYPLGATLVAGQSGSSDPERLTEISENAREIDMGELDGEDPLTRFEKRDE